MGKVIMEEHAEVVEGVMNALSEGQPDFGVLVAQRLLHGVAEEETMDAGNGKGHET
jgi:hypothetical protein